MLDLVIYGAGGMGREILELVRASDPTREKWNFIGFIDDGIPVNTSLGDAAVLGGVSWLSRACSSIGVIMGLADPIVKSELYSVLSQNPKVEFPVVVHPWAYVESTASLSPGTVVSSFCFVAVDAFMGVCSFLNVASQVGHDSVVGDFCSIMPSVNISGNVTIGPRTLVGVGSKILQGLRIGSGATVGIGSVVLNDVPDGCTVMGYPARVVKKGREDS